MLTALFLVNMLGLLLLFAIYGALTRVLSEIKILKEYIETEEELNMEIQERHSLTELNKNLNDSDNSGYDLLWKNHNL